MNKQNHLKQYHQNTSSSITHLTRTPLQSKMNKNNINEHVLTNNLGKTPEVFKSKSVHLHSQLKNTSVTYVNNTIEDKDEDYKCEKECNNDNCVYLYSPKKKLNLDLTPPQSSSPILIQNDCHLIFSPLPIKQLTYISSGDIELMKEYDTFINGRIDYEE